MMSIGPQMWWWRHLRAELGIGTATFLPGYGPTSTSRPGPSLVCEALSAGVRYVDTAAAYGASETILGDLSQDLAKVGARIATKVAVSTGAQDITTAVEASLTRLRVSSLDTVMAHSANRQQIADSADAFQRVREAGLAARVGASTYGRDDAVFAASSWCDAVQVEFSILNQAVVSAIRQQVTRPVEVVVRSVLCKGLLTGGGAKVPMPPVARRTLQDLSELAASIGIDLPTLAIRFALDTPGVDVVLVGVASDRELRTALSARQFRPLTPTEYSDAAAFDCGDADWVHPERWVNGVPAV